MSETAAQEVVGLLLILNGDSECFRRSQDWQENGASTFNYHLSRHLYHGQCAVASAQILLSYPTNDALYAVIRGIYLLDAFYFLIVL
jgi:hypothetical protein